MGRRCRARPRVGRPWWDTMELRRDQVAAPRGTGAGRTRPGACDAPGGGCAGSPVRRRAGAGGPPWRAPSAWAGTARHAGRRCCVPRWPVRTEPWSLRRRLGAVRLASKRRLDVRRPVIEGVRAATAVDRMALAPMPAELAVAAGELGAAVVHADPADRLNVAASPNSRVPLVTIAGRVRAWGAVPTVWPQGLAPREARHAARAPGGELRGTRTVRRAAPGRPVGRFSAMGGPGPLETGAAVGPAPGGELQPRARTVASPGRTA